MVSIYRHSIPRSFGTADNFCPAGDLTGRSHGSDPVFPVPADSLLPVRSYHPSGTYYGSLPQRYETNGLSRSDSGLDKDADDASGLTSDTTNTVAVNAPDRSSVSFQIYNQRIRKISPLKDSRTKSFRSIVPTSKWSTEWIL